MVVGDLATSVEVLVLGAGPGGYTAAVQLAQLGKEVALIDPGPPGGSLRDSYLPLRALLTAAGQFRRLSQAPQPGLVLEHPPPGSTGSNYAPGKIAWSRSEPRK